MVVGIAAAELPIAVVNPRQARALAQAIGRTAKTDAIDAGVLAAFGGRVDLPARPVADAATRALAALMARRVVLPQNESAALVVTGGNIDVNIIGRIIDRGLVKDGRITHLMVKVPDRPGSLERLTRIVAEAGANVLEVAHRRAFADVSVADVEIELHLETRGRDHVIEIMRQLTAAGLKVEEDV